MKERKKKKEKKKITKNASLRACRIALEDHRRRISKPNPPTIPVNVFG